MRPQSGMRPGSQMKSSYGPQVGAQGISIGKNVEVSARPTVLREGMKASGAVPGTSHGPARAVVDGSYCIGLLRPKVAELTAEIDRLRAEENQIVRGESTLGQLQERQKSLIDDLAKLKSTMSDINFAVERANNQDADSINKEAVSLRSKNAEQRKLVDKIFLKAKETEKQIQATNSKLEQEIYNLETHLSSTNQDVQYYRQVRNQAYDTTDNVLRQLHEIRAAVCRRDLLMSNISTDIDKTRAASVLLEILGKRQKRERMQKECSITIEQERQNLILEGKTTSSDIDILIRQLQESKDALKETENRIASTQEDLQEYSGDNARKFQELQQKDHEMQEFIDQFSEKEAEELKKIHQAETSIIQILERTSRAYELKAQMPQESSVHALEQLSAELNEKENQCKNAKITHQRLEKEVEERKEELKKIVTLDDKIATELISIAEKIEEHKQDVVRYSDIDALRNDIEVRKKKLIARKHFLLKQRDSSKSRVNTLTMEFEAKRKSLEESVDHTNLSALEQKLRLIRQSSYSLEEFVRIKEKDTQYEPIKAVCMRITDECNQILKDPKRFQATGVAFN
eukprot:Tbor_TRINITY_DN3969_c0_g1::TRINITY_DN3969_c0_g1_i1::g.811::m.811/K19679/IFT74; intraflagellar transport protein 74